MFAVHLLVPGLNFQQCLHLVGRAMHGISSGHFCGLQGCERSLLDLSQDADPKASIFHLSQHVKPFLQGADVNVVDSDVDEQALQQPTFDHLWNIKVGSCSCLRRAA